jgi:5-methylcytosine-specific restriction endonuclease McrA
VGKQVICEHGVTPKNTCIDCRREAGRRSYRKHIDYGKKRANYQANPAKQIVLYHNSRAKKAGAKGIITAELYQQIVSAPCVYCGYDKFIELDHKIAVTKGGSNEPENLQPVCRYCNRSKYAYDEADFLEWLQRLRQVVTD